MLDREIVGAPQPARVKRVVVVHEQQVFAARLLDRDIAGVTRPAGVLQLDHPDVRPVTCEVVQPLHGAVSGTVVGEDDLQPARGQADGVDGVEDAL